MTSKMKNIIRISVISRDDTKEDGSQDAQVGDRWKVKVLMRASKRGRKGSTDKNSKHVVLNISWRNSFFQLQEKLCKILIFPLLLCF